jgi:tRNA A64-2'-O-ribosylphosphate transferase
MSESSQGAEDWASSSPVSPVSPAEHGDGQDGDGQDGDGQDGDGQDGDVGAWQLLDWPVFGLPQGFQLSLPGQPSMTRILRDVKRQEHSIRNMVASIVYDAQTFVRRVGQGYAGWPVYGNKRCGAWYVPPDAFPGRRTCYFKSTDGHVNEWSFSFARLNLHVALEAVRRGGCVVVDATRRGKMFPDALSKTVPIWCAVLNTAVALYRVDAGVGEGDGPGLELPPWVPQAEMSQIEARIDAWAMQLLDAGIDEFETLAKNMTAPLACVWAHPSHATLPEVCKLRQGRTVVVLASASVHDSRARRTLVLEGGEKEREKERETERETLLPFDYVAGAADDEESWAMGLTPAVMWANYRDILLGDDEERFVRRVVKECRAGEIDGGDEHAEALASIMTRVPGTGVGIASRAYAMRHAESLRNSGVAIVNVSSRDLGDVVDCRPSALTCSTTLAAGSVKSKDCRVMEMDAVDPGNITAYCWIADGASRKHPVVEYAPCAAAFVSYHAGRGRDVVFVFDDVTASIAAALLLVAIISLFTIDGSKFHRTTEGYRVDVASGSVAPAVGSKAFSRAVFRTYVAKVTVQMPHIILRKSVLKEVFNVFIR